MARAEAVLSRIGVTRVANVTGLDHVGVPVWVAVRPLGRSVSVSQGKGTTHALARISAIMESVESFHAEHLQLNTRACSLDQAKHSQAFATVADLPFRQTANVHTTLPVDWIEGTDLISGQSKWVPREAVDLDYSQTRQPSAGLFVSSSTGLASGNSIVEAQIHGLCEVIERDQIAFWESNQSDRLNDSRTRLDLSSIAAPGIRQLLDQIASAKLQIAVWYLSTTNSVPCFGCTVFDPARFTCYPQRASGYGCHPLKAIALSRAITEALQSRLTHIAGNRDDMSRQDYRDRLPMSTKKNKEWLERITGETMEFQFVDIPEYTQADNAHLSLDWLLKQVRCDGIEQVICVDLTRSFIGIPVVRMLAPAMEDEPGRGDSLAGRRLTAYRTSTDATIPDKSKRKDKVQPAPSRACKTTRHATSTCIFIGPTYAPVNHAFDLHVPASMGSIYLAVKAGYQRIALVDGVFGNCASVWHKEILFALSEGVAVYGAASMGALRVAELEQFGMQGIGRVYQLYQSGVLTDDDEVCQWHWPKELEFRRISEALVDIRDTLDDFEKKGFVDSDSKHCLLHRMKERHFSVRTEDKLIADAVQILGRTRGVRFANAYKDAKENKANAKLRLKQRDWLELVAHLTHDEPPDLSKRDWTFPVTDRWLKEVCESEIPTTALERWND